MGIKEGLEVYEEMNKELEKLNTSRGGSSKQFKGFVAEITNTTEANIKRASKGIAAREHVLDNNGPADAVVHYSNGQLGYSIQDKCGYNGSQIKNMIRDGKYDGQRLRVNSDNPIFDSKHVHQLNQINQMADEHGIKLEKSLVSGEENERLGKMMSVEGNIRSKFNMESNAPVTAKVYTRHKEAEYIASEAKKNIDNTIDNVNDSVNNIVENIGGENLAQIHQESMNAAVGAMSVAAITTLVDNSVKVARGEKTKEEAIRDSAKTIGETGIARYTQKTVSQIAENVINKTMQESVLKIMVGKAGNDTAVVVVKTGQEFVKYCRSEISVDDMLENTSEIIKEQIVQFIGGMVFSVLPIPGSEYIGRYVATVLYHSSKQIKMEQEQFDNYISFMESISRETTKEIEMYRKEFAAYTTEYNAKAMQQMNKAFGLLEQGMSEDNVEKASEAIETIANMVGETVSDITEDSLYMG